jgi:hypothetical protein
MKARKLREILNNINFTLSNDDDCICVGGAYCHDVISVNKKTLEVKYILDTSHEGRKAIKNKDHLFIWDTLHRLIETEEIREIIDGKDVIENPLPVFTVNGGKLVESVTDKYGWPNTDDDGILMYNNTHFPTKKRALKYGIEELSASIEIYDRRIGEHEEEIKELRMKRNSCDLAPGALKEQWEEMRKG